MVTADDTDGVLEGCIAIVVRGTTAQGQNPTSAGPHQVAEFQQSGVPPPTVIYFEEVLAVKSGYLSALLGSGMKEAQARRVDLTQLDPRAVRAVLRYLEDPTAAFDALLWSYVRDWPPDDTRLIAEAFDYLQVAECDTIVQALQILHCPGGVRSEFVRQGWFDEETWRVLAIPSSRKTRHWRFWVCFLLCLQLMPEVGQPMDQVAFTEMLKPYGGDADAITLRREMVEYGLISRVGDGSEYWRPLYTSRMMSQWIDGMPRPIV
jgi:hypothetical protein